MQRVMTAAAIVACVLGLSACNDDSAGSTGSGGPKVGGGGIAGSADAGGSGKTGTPLAGADACTLLKPADVPELSQDDYMKPTNLNTSRGSTCAGYDFSVEIKDVTPDVYHMDFHGSEVKALPDIAGHKAAMSETTVGSLKSCNVVLEVTTQELVTVTVMKPCDIAQKAAAVVAGRLPK